MLRALVACDADADCAALPKTCCPHYGPGPATGCDWLRCLEVGQNGGTVAAMSVRTGTFRLSLPGRHRREDLPSHASQRSFAGCGEKPLPGPPPQQA
ncbi:unnamed protein product [Effrenium voratum]|nr:unnamed protein product [Effrenium voratum]